MEPAAKLSDKDKGDDQQDSFYYHAQENADTQHQPQGAHSEKKAIDTILVEFYITSRNSPCLQEPFCSDGSYPLDHLILLNRRRDSGALA